MRVLALRLRPIAAYYFMSSCLVSSTATAGLGISARLAEYLESRISVGLQDWRCSREELRTTKTSELVASLLKGSGEYKAVVDRCLLLSRTLKSSPSDLSLLQTDAASLAALEQRFKDSVAAKTGAFAVKRGNKKPRLDIHDAVYGWAENCILAHFRRKGARKAYLKHLETHHQIAAAVVSADHPSDENCLEGDLFADGSRIKVLDVGSVGNLLLEREGRLSLEVTPVFLVDSLPSSVAAVVTPFDAIILNCALSQIANPDLRPSFLRRMSELSLPLGSCAQPHRSSLLLLVERCDEFSEEDLGKAKTDMRALGFEFVRKSFINGGGSESRVGLVFVVVRAAVGSPVTVTSIALRADSRPQPSGESPHRKGKVAIIGGGIGGSALCALLLRRGVDAVIFERDEDMHARKQGYAITLQQGLKIMRALDIDLSGTSTGTVTSQSHSSFDEKGELLGAYGHAVVKGKCTAVSVSRAKAHNLHMPRQQLRQLFVHRIPPDRIKWNKRLDRLVDRPGSDSVELHFSDGSIEQAALVVAADGIYSTVRQQRLPEAGLKYLGLMVILGISPYSAGSPGEPRRQAQWLDSVTRVFTMPFDAEHTMWQMSFPCNEQDALALVGQPAALLQLARERCSGWDPVLVSILAASDADAVSGHPAYDRDPFEPEQWREEGSDKNSRVCLLGDAAHPMSPFKGQGANQALIDALSLSEALMASELISPSRRPIPLALASYEREMSVRSREKVVRSRIAAQSLHGPDALRLGNVTRASAAASTPGLLEMD